LFEYILAAGDAFCRAASVQLKCGSKHEAATQYVDASTCYKKADPAGNSYSIAFFHCPHFNQFKNLGTIYGLISSGQNGRM